MRQRNEDEKTLKPSFKNAVGFAPNQHFTWTEGGEKNHCKQPIWVL